MEKHLFLCGYRGSGKTTIAKRLASNLTCDWIDTDDQIEQTAGCSIAEIFAAEGEQGFRDREQEVLRQVCAMSPRVVALGGGAVLRESNRLMIASAGFTIWLDASASVLADRIGKDVTTGARRPSLTGADVLEEIEEVLAARRPIYEQVSNHRVNADQSTIDQIVNDVIAYIEAP